MAINLGSTPINGIYIGCTPLNVYVGSTLVYQAASVAESFFASAGSATLSAEFDPPPVLGSVTYDGTDTISIALSEPATIYYLVDDNASRTPAQVEAGGGEAAGSFAVDAGANSDVISLGGVSSGAHYLHIVAKDATGNYSTVNSTEYTFSEPIVITAIGVESASEVGTASIVPIGWKFTGSVVTNLPATEGWEFTGSVIDTIPSAA